MPSRPPKTESSYGIIFIIALVLDGEALQKKAEGPRIRREKKTVNAMIRLYCRKHHESDGELCSDCQELDDYAMLRLTYCPFEENKSTCGKCLVHCYKPELRTKISNVMRYSGPRMLLHHPIMAFQHVFDGRRKPLTLEELKELKKKASS
jgi:hypothetical protein